MELLLVFFDDMESSEDATLEAIEARLTEVKLAVSKEERELVEAGIEMGVRGWSWG